MTPTILGILLIIQGAGSADWGVKFQTERCAVRGASVTIPCSYSYPPVHRVTLVAWSREWYDTSILGWRNAYLTEDPSLQGRVQYLGDRVDQCTLMINNLQYTDQGLYSFRFRTQRDTWTSRSSVKLTVEGPEVTATVVPAVVKEGDVVTLTCRTKCISNPPVDAVWWRDGKAVSGTTFQARPEDTGGYQCVVEGQRSDAQLLDVQYLPHNTSVWVEPPGVVSSGSSVNLTCSSDANPPVHTYTWWWYSGTTPPPVGSVPVQVGTGPVLHLSSLNASQTGTYLCGARNPLGEHNVSALLQMEETTEGGGSVVVLSGVGGAVFLVIVIVLVCLWSQKLRRTKENEPRANASSADSTEADPTYANIDLVSLPNRTLTPSQGVCEVHSLDSAQAHGSQEEDIAYSTIKFRETRPVKHADSNPEEQSSQSTEAADAGDHLVIYDMVAKAT